MSRHETQMSPEMQRELEAVDAAIRDEAVATAQAPLAELARSVRMLRARPSEEFNQMLDSRAARGFEREDHDRAAAGGSPGRGWTAMRNRLAGHRAPRRALLFPAAGLALAAVLAVLLTVSLGGSDGRRSPSPLAEKAQPALVHAKTAEGGRGTGKSAAGAAGAPGAAAVTHAAVPQASGAPAAAARQVERTSTLEVGVAPDSVQSASQRVFTLVSAFGGYVRQSSVNSGGAGQGGSTFDIRVPSAKLAAAIAALADLGHVRSENDTTNDVTDQLGSLQRSLGGLRAERASLLRQLAAATEAQQVAKLKAQLHGVEVRISQVQGTLRALTTRINYTSLALSLTPESSAGTASGDLTPGKAAHEAVRILDAALAVLVIGAAVVLPLALAIVAAWIAIALLRRRLREQALDAS
jgi:Domain of unknown function (DUF4349)